VGERLLGVEVFCDVLGGLDRGFMHGAKSETPIVKRLVPS